MRRRIHQIELNQDHYKYNFIGLFAVAVNRELQRKHAFFCSQFVATIVNESGIQMFSIPPNLVQPHHFAQLKCLKRVYEGDLQSDIQNVRKIEERALTPTKMGMGRHLAVRVLS